MEIDIVTQEMRLVFYLTVGGGDERRGKWGNCPHFGPGDAGNETHSLCAYTAASDNAV